jgi:hypothetical protein
MKSIKSLLNTIRFGTSWRKKWNDMVNSLPLVSRKKYESEVERLELGYASLFAVTRRIVQELAVIVDANGRREIGNTKAIKAVEALITQTVMQMNAATREMQDGTD